ncbi:MAG: inorganic diphosphatase [Candidatus Doudnabacteria bacterium]|nr:inorganic diphosphatase [Candidatus Doudnabacteria bacterium]
MKLKDTPSGSPEQFNVVIEIPKGSNYKYEYDETTGKMKLDFIFNNLVYPFNYGFIPNTKAEDGDTLDCGVISDKIFPSGTVVTCRPIAVMKQLDRGKQDDKIMAVPVDEPERELTDQEKRRFTDFYAEVAKQKLKVVTVTGYGDKSEAIATITKAMA